MFADREVEACPIGTVGRAMVIWIILGVLWQGGLVVRALKHVAESGATGFGFVWRGFIEFAVTVIVLGWVSGSIWYLVRAKR